MVSKDIKSFRIEHDIIEFAKNNKISLGSWLNVNFRKYEMDIDGLEVKLKRLQDELEATKKNIVEAKKLKKKMKFAKIGEKELKFLIEMSKLLKDKPNLLNQIVDWYNTKFYKELTQRDFKKLLEEIK